MKDVTSVAATTHIFLIYSQVIEQCRSNRVYLATFRRYDSVQSNLTRRQITLIHDRAQSILDLLDDPRLLSEEQNRLHQAIGGQLDGKFFKNTPQILLYPDVSKSHILLLSGLIEMVLGDCSQSLLVLHPNALGLKVKIVFVS
ncbi:unnamed protein product [Echinostoma caproni]|uniref:FHA domain-containing protein n=1 Tax=Echinostoma caproni TaxID=27848 RepID=A0A183A335_9TREM|nr:unnamed protein product [Echinostoma caproni]